MTQVQVENVSHVQFILAMQQPSNQDLEMPWGGKRPGSGPKVDPEGERVHVTARVKPSTLKKLKDEAKRLKQSIGRVLDRWSEDRK